MSQPPGWRGRRWRQGIVVVALTAMVIGAAAGCGWTTSRAHPSVALTEAATLAPRRAPPGPNLAVAPSTVAVGASMAPTTGETAVRASTPTPLPLLAMTGRGFQTTQRFRTPAAWAITYQFDCARYGAAGNFQVVVYTQGQLVEVAINGVAWSGHGQAFEQHAAGETYLQINSECDWQVVAEP